MELDIDQLYDYYLALFLKKKFDITNYFENHNITEEDCYKYAYLFWLYRFNKKLDLNNEEDIDKLYGFLDRLFKYKMVNELIEEEYNSLFYDDKNNFINKNYDYLNRKVEEARKFVIDFYEKVDLSTLPKLSNEELDAYFRDYLMYIDPEGDYLNIYNHLIKSGRLIYLDSLSNEQQEEILIKYNVFDETYRNFTYRDSVNGTFLVLDRKGDISDFRNLAHEFTHYVTRYSNSHNSNLECDLVREFPNMFYEFVANSYLISKGYKTEDIAKLNASRCNHIYDTCNQFGVVNDYFSIYRDCGSVTRKEDVLRRKQEISNFISRAGKSKAKELVLKDPNIFNPDVLADDLSDSCAVILYNIPSLMKQSYNYIIGFYLASKYYLKLSKNNNILKDMKNYTMSLPSLDIDELFKKVDSGFVKYQKKMS